MLSLEAPEGTRYPGGQRALSVPRPARFDIRDYGPNVVPGVDCTTAIQGTIAAAVAVQGEVYIPPGRWLASPQAARTTATTTINAQGHALVVPAAGGVTICGESRSLSAIDFRAFGGGSPETSYQVVSADGAVWRGGGLFLDGGTSSGSAAAPIVIRDLELFGGALNTGNAAFPANPSTGDGWDLTHKGVWLRNAGFFKDVLIERCHIHGFKGELIYGGANSLTQLGNVTGRSNDLHDTNGDCWSVVGAAVTFEDNDCYQAAGNGVEDNYFHANCSYRRNRIRDIGLHGMWIYPGYGTGPYGVVDIEDNRVERTGLEGIRADNPQNVSVRDNKVIDAGTSSTYSGIHVGAVGGTNGPTKVRGAVVERNVVLAHSRAMFIGVQVYDEGGAPDTRLVVRDNIVGLTTDAVAAGYTVTQGFDLAAITDPKAIVHDNTSRGSIYLSSDTGNVREFLLSTTALTDVVKRRPQMLGNYQVLIYYRVVTAPTLLTVTVSWYDAAGAQSLDIVSAISAAVGSHAVQPLVINVVGDSEAKYVKVSAQAATANQVYLSAQLIEMPNL